MSYSPTPGPRVESHDDRRRDAALAALDDYRRLVESQPTPIFDELARRAALDEVLDWRPPEQAAATAGEEDHSDPDVFRGAPADPPVSP